MTLSGAACAAHRSQTPSVERGDGTGEQGGGAVVGGARAACRPARWRCRRRRARSPRSARPARRPPRSRWPSVHFVRHQSARSCLALTGLACAGPGRKPCRRLPIPRAPRCAMQRVERLSHEQDRRPRFQPSAARRRPAGRGFRAAEAAGDRLRGRAGRARLALSGAAGRRMGGR